MPDRDRYMVRKARPQAGATGGTACPTRGFDREGLGSGLAAGWLTGGTACPTKNQTEQATVRRERIARLRAEAGGDRLPHEGAVAPDENGRGEWYPDVISES